MVNRRTQWGHLKGVISNTVSIVDEPEEGGVAKIYISNYVWNSIKNGLTSYENFAKNINIT